MSLAAVNTDIEKGRRIRARKDAEGQEQIIALQSLKERIAELVTLKIAAKTAADEYGEAINAAAEKAGLQASTVRKFVAARAGDKFEDRKRDADQLVLCFEEIGSE